MPAITIPDPSFWRSKASLLASGLDTVVEAFDIAIPDTMCDRLEAARLRAEALSEDLSGREVFTLGGIEFQMIALRGKGLRWRLENDDIAIRIRPVKMGYPVSVRYSAAGLWEHGYAKLHQKAERAVRALGCPRGADWQRLSEVHRAFDFHAPDFTPEMRPGLIGQVIAHSEINRKGICGRDFETDEIWGKAGRLETLTIGKRAPLEIQVYDKGREIEEASGKTWMLALWERSGAWTRTGTARQEHCWRIEVRFRSDFLRNRSVLTMADYVEAQAALLQAVKKHGADMSDFLRAAVARAIIEQPGPTPIELHEYYKLSRLLVGAAHNINQYVTLANQARLSGSPHPQADELIRLARELHRDSRRVLAILDKWG